MADAIRELLSKWDIVALVIGINMFLGGLASVFRWVSAKTKKVTWDDKVAAWLSKSSGWTAKIVDFLNGNNEHPKEEKKPPQQ